MKILRLITFIAVFLLFANAEEKKQEEVHTIKGVEVRVDSIEHKGNTWEPIPGDVWNAGEGNEFVLINLKLRCPESLSKFELKNVKITDTDGNEYKITLKVGNSLMSLNTASCFPSEGKGSMMLFFCIPEGKVLNKLYLEEVSFDLGKIPEHKKNTTLASDS